MPVRKPDGVRRLRDGTRVCHKKTTLGEHLQTRRSRKTIQDWFNHGAFPERLKKPPYRLDEIEEWARVHIANTGAKARGDNSSDNVNEKAHTERQQLELQRLREGARLSKLKADALEGRYVERTLVNGVMMNYVKLVRSRIEEWCEGLPPQMVGLKVTEARTLLRDAYDRLCEDMVKVTHITPATESQQRRALPSDPKHVKAGKAGGRHKKRKPR